MPSKRDARYNAPAVAQPQFAYLGLHQAALSGNVGLVQYALSQGQPVDAVWDGISALHSAAAGGSEHVARLLIENGADVNFGRLPRNERDLKTRTASSSSSSSPALDKVPDGRQACPSMKQKASLIRNHSPTRSERELKPRSASTSSTSFPEALLNPGSTPLHFACAHNHVLIARLLLAHGAAPHIPDKRGVTPVDLLPPASSPDVSTASSSSPSSDALSIRAVIREYYELEKAKEKEFQKSHNGAQLRFHGKAAAVLGFPREDDTMRKRSIENLLSKSPKHVPSPLMTTRRGMVGIGTPPPSPRLPPSPPTSPSRYTFGHATPTSHGPTSTTPVSAPTGGTPPHGLEQRRPSLPHLFDDPYMHAPSLSPPVPSSAPGGGRPRSAGEDSQPPAFGSSAVSFGSSGHARPRTKRSLLSLFKKGDSTPEGVDVVERDRERERERERKISASGHEVHTAPPERTTFTGARGVVPEDVFCDDEEDYGVPLPGTKDEFGASPPDSEDESETEETVQEYDDEHTETVTNPTRFVPPKHAEGWYRDRVESMPAPRESHGEGKSGSGSGSDTPPRRPGILRGDHSVRTTTSRGALRFEAREGVSVREKESRSSLRTGQGRGRGDSVSSASTDTRTSTTMTSVSVYADDSSELEEDDDALNIRTVSNHAQAEALVQRATKEILELNTAAAVVDTEPAPLPGLSLSAQLAAYGETVQLQRRFAKGEAQRFKSPTQARFDGGGDEEEEERQREAQERMVWSQRMMERYATERRGRENELGCPLERTTSLEKDAAAAKPRQPRIRRPHTSDSVRSSGSGTAAPPRFGHSSTHSSSTLRPQPRAFTSERHARHHASRSASAHPRAESFDMLRPSAPAEHEPVPVRRSSPEEEEEVLLDSASSSRSLALAAANRSAYLASTTALDEFGSTARAVKQRFGGLRSLFGKGK